jgi:hypothetical protein
MTILRCAFLLLAASGSLAAQAPADLTPAVARLIRTYSETPDGAGFFDVRAAVPELKGNGLWVRYGEDGKPPVRIDRATGAAKVIGRPGDGPNEYRQTGDIVAGADGLMGVRDVGRQLFFWVDKDGVQRRTWPVPMTDNMMNKTFTDTRGRVYMGRTPVVNGVFGDPIILRVDSARGLVDTTPTPFKRSDAGKWATRTANGATQMYVQFAASPDWGIDRQGRVFGYWSDSNFIQLKDGTKTSRLLVPVWREPLSDVDKKAANDRLDAFERGQKANKAEFLGPRPPVPRSSAPWPTRPAGSSFAAPDRAGHLRRGGRRSPAPRHRTQAGVDSWSGSTRPASVSRLSLSRVVTSYSRSAPIRYGLRGPTRTTL